MADDPRRMHRWTDDSERLAQAVLAFARDRLRQEPPPLGGPRPAADLTAAAGPTVTADGLGWERALGLFTDVLAPATVAIDHPRYLSFIPSAPTGAAALFDLVLGVTSIYGGTWLEAAGAVHAENEALGWLAGLAGLPGDAGGAFVPGGTAGNLAALVTARHAFLARRGGARPARLAVAATAAAHSSIATAARVMDVDVLGVAADAAGRMTGPALAAAVEGGGDGLFAVAASAGTTNAGVVDDLQGVADVCRSHGLWMHVDGAYGAAALAAPSARPRFAGIEACDSLIVDPHKWLFAPFDCCALLYRTPGIARAAHTQSADYLEVFADGGEWNPSDFAVHLSRRARGLPFWFSLAVHGTRAYADAIEAGLELARAAAAEVRRRPELELLVEPELSVVVFARRGWDAADYRRWSDALMADGVGFVMPTSLAGRPATRLAFVNPRTTLTDVTAILDTMA